MEYFEAMFCILWCYL